ncbi:hypothetical protein PAXRUDRAFT_821616 [Paxillus rubicundulus Ve08.2h10]|uniref:Unplaced genomic scaffold scaffold_10, whole genome shotgun sequence n=1 Tax=Paxillus rubicundulus Ve08.2h10 TaxID=930991 RepID=A0A0D0DNL5_9AGAM|nr:hypothetical protein PAXRUDRAFT_821616 [Paxillus rubicundulus Ve08.2h10]
MPPKNVTKVLYKPDTQSTDEFLAIVNPVEYKKWKAGDTTISLTEVVDSFEIFHSGQGAQGYLGRPSKQQLENIFGTSKDIDAMKILLEKGKEQQGDGFTWGANTMNPTRGSAVVDKGKGLSGF